MKKPKLLPNLLLPIIAVIVINSLVFSLQWNDIPRQSDGWLNPPGILVGSVWIALFLFMGMARDHLLKCQTEDTQRLARIVLWYMGFCLIYPFYTLSCHIRR